MLYCDQCQIDRRLPVTSLTHEGRCELCRKNDRICFEYKSRKQQKPEPAIKERHNA